MADNNANQTTSSKLLEGISTYPHPKILKVTSPPMPKSSEAQLLTKLADNLSESYQIVKQRQRKYNELSARGVTMVKRSQSVNDSEMHHHIDSESSSSSGSGGEWQEVISNKLKRKKKLSTSLTSVTDSVNQEKRTRIEGIQLNCRGRLQINETASGVSVGPAGHGSMNRSEKLIRKPPLPPVTSSPSSLRSANAARTAGGVDLATVAKSAPPPRLKRKLLENLQTIQKLNALTEQLRLEINELKTNLHTERSAVRVLRAQNESETRKWKNEVKKLQHVLDLIKKSGSVDGRSKRPQEGVAETLPNANSASGLVHYEIQRLTNEIMALKEANKASDEKKLIDCDADRRKAADIRELKDSYEIRLTQLQKSAKIEISRLLEEIKTKERNIGQLKKDLQILQNKTHGDNKSQNPSRNATTNTTTNKTINNNKNNKKLNLNKQKQINKNDKSSTTTQRVENKNTKENKANISRHVAAQETSEELMVEAQRTIKELRRISTMSHNV